MDDVKRYTAHGIQRESGWLIDFVSAADYDTLHAELATANHSLEALNICENCSPLDEANAGCPLCRLKEYRERDDAAFRQTIGELEAELAAVMQIVERLAKQGTGVIQPTKLELDAIAVMTTLPAAARALLDDHDNMKAMLERIHTVVGSELGNEESVADGVEALLDEVGRLRERVKELEGTK